MKVGCFFIHKEGVRNLINSGTMTNLITSMEHDNAVNSEHNELILMMVTVYISGVVANANPPKS